MKPIKRRLTLTEYDDGSWSINEEVRETGSIYPTIDKENARDMVARVMQLVKVGPVAPQTYPERIGIDLPERGGQ